MIATTPTLYIPPVDILLFPILIFGIMMFVAGWLTRFILLRAIEKLDERRKK